MDSQKLPKKPYNVQLVDTIDLFVWRARLRDTLGNIWGEQLLIKNIDTTRLKSNAILWLGSGWDTVQLPRVQLLDKRAATLPRTAIIELWEDSLHSFRKRIEIPAGYDGVAFDILRPMQKRVVQTVVIDEPIVSVWEDLVRVDILARDSDSIPTEGRAVFYIKHHSNSVKVQVASYINSGNTEKRSGWDIPIQRPHKTTTVELHIKSSKLRYSLDEERFKMNFYDAYYYLFTNTGLVEWDILGQLIALCDAKQYAPKIFDNNPALTASILDTLAIFQNNLAQFEKTKEILPHLSWSRLYIQSWQQAIAHTIYILRSSAKETNDLQKTTTTIFNNIEQNFIIVEMNARELPLEDYKKIYQFSGNLFPTGILVPWVSQELDALRACTPANLSEVLAKPLL